MLDKRKIHFERLAEEIEKRRENAGDSEPSLHSEKPRVVDNAMFFSRIHQMRQKGGAGNVPLC
jgi:hypothetical protein